MPSKNIIGFMFCCSVSVLLVVVLQYKSEYLSTKNDQVIFLETKMVDGNQDNALVHTYSRSLLCSEQYLEEGGLVSGCHPDGKGRICKQSIFDNFAFEEEVERLKTMADRALSLSTGIPAPKYGPAILDINQGMVLHGDGLYNIYEQNETIYTEDEYSFYKSIIDRIKRMIIEEFGLELLYFTAPTFITRTRGHPLDWQFRQLHDEYWHMHADKNNTPHYDYSGLLYLSDWSQDFEGGQLTFWDEQLNKPTMRLSPFKGRLAIFNSGRENPHEVGKVTSGTRYVLSLWFTCDSRREFKTFLDGKAHYTYEGNKNKGVDDISPSQAQVEL